MKDQATSGYARAIFEIAKSEDALERVADELFQVARRLESSHELRQALTDIALPSDAKEKLLDEVLGKRVSQHTVSVIKFIVTQGKARSLVEIADELARMAEAESRREIAEVRTTAPLDEKQKKRLTAALEKATGKDLSVKVVVDPTILGGVVARVGDMVIDASVKRKLQTLREHLRIGT